MFRLISVYFRLILLLAVIVLVVWVTVKNRQHTVTVWFFRDYANINVLWLILWTALGSIVCFWILTRVLGLYRDLKDLARQQEQKKREAEQKQTAQKLAEQERRIDEKIQKSLTDSQ